ncbi:MAG TPA: NTP transferase domain-containing protein [Candidatus Limnocylindrales bacterium]
MTVAAVILAASVESALADADGQPRVRRLVDLAWSGGTIPIVVVAPDPDGSVAAALAGAAVTLAEPAPQEGGPVGQMLRGIDVATAEVRGTDAAILWPARYMWVGPETITSLIEAHGIGGGTLLRPSFNGEPGWPVLVPFAQLDRLREVTPRGGPDEIVAALLDAGAATRTVEVGDPGVVHDAATARDALPAYVGPPEPAAPHTHEWGATGADLPEDTPLEGPTLAPYGQAADPDEEG